MKLSEKEKEHAYKAITGMWNSLKQYGKPADRSDEYWKPLIEADVQICRECDDDPLVVFLLKGFEDGLEAYLRREIEGSKT